MKMQLCKNSHALYKCLRILENMWENTFCVIIHCSLYISYFDTMESYLCKERGIKLNICAKQFASNVPLHVRSHLYHKALPNHMGKHYDFQDTTGYKQIL
jgi:hypothetical protein